MREYYSVKKFYIVYKYFKIQQTPKNFKFILILIKSKILMVTVLLYVF